MHPGYPTPDTVVQPEVQCTPLVCTDVVEHDIAVRVDGHALGDRVTLEGEALCDIIWVCTQVRASLINTYVRRSDPNTRRMQSFMIDISYTGPTWKPRIISRIACLTDALAERRHQRRPHGSLLEFDRGRVCVFVHHDAA